MKSDSCLRIQHAGHRNWVLASFKCKKYMFLSFGHPQETCILGVTVYVRCLQFICIKFLLSKKDGAKQCRSEDSKRRVGGNISSKLYLTFVFTLKDNIKIQTRTKSSFVAIFPTILIFWAGIVSEILKSTPILAKKYLKIFNQSPTSYLSTSSSIPNSVLVSLVLLSQSRLQLNLDKFVITNNNSY